MAVIAKAQQNCREQGAARLELVGPIDGSQQRLVGPCVRLTIRREGWDRVNVTGRDRDVIQERPPGGPGVAALIVRRHMALVAPEPANPTPRKLRPIRFARQAFVQALRDRAA